FDMLAGAATLDQVMRGFVDVFGDGNVTHINLAAAAAHTGMGGAGLGQAPVPGQDINPVLVLAVLSFAHDVVVQFQKTINRHIKSPSGVTLRLPMLVKRFTFRWAVSTQGSCRCPCPPSENE